MTAVLATALPAWADRQESTLIRAVAAKERALELDDPLHWDEALRRFREADALGSTFETQYEIGNAAAELEQQDIAVEAFEHALALGLKGKARERAQAYVDAHAAQLSRLRVSGPAGARVLIGGELRGELPLKDALVVYAGNVSTSVRFSDGREATQTYEAHAGQLHELTFAAPPPAELRAPPPAPSPPPPRATALPWTLIAASAATSLGGAILIPVSAHQLSNRRSDLRAACDVQSDEDGCDHVKPGRANEAQSNADSIATWKAARTIGWAALGTGLAAGGVGIWLLNRPQASTESQRTSVTPWLESSERGWTAGFQGRF